MTNLFFKNQRTGKKYKVVKLDKEKGQIILQGAHGEFAEPYDKERFKQMGYSLEKEDDDAEQQELRS